MSTDFDQLYDALNEQLRLLRQQRNTIDREMANIGSMKLLVYPHTNKKLESTAELPWEEGYVDKPYVKKPYSSMARTKVKRYDPKEDAGDLPWDA